MLARPLTPVGRPEAVVPLPPPLLPVTVDVEDAVDPLLPPLPEVLSGKP